MIYVASPYSSPDPIIQNRRHQNVANFCARGIHKGFLLFSPIVYAHNLAHTHNLPKDANSWMRFNLALLRKCEAVYVVCLDGWMESQGVGVELKVAQTLSIPVAHYELKNGIFWLMDDHWKGHLEEKF